MCLFQTNYSSVRHFFLIVKLWNFGISLKALVRQTCASRTSICARCLFGCLYCWSSVWLMEQYWMEQYNRSLLVMVIRATIVLVPPIWNTSRATVCSIMSVYRKEVSLLELVSRRILLAVVACFQILLALVCIDFVLFDFIIWFLKHAHFVCICLPSPYFCRDPE